LSYETTSYCHAYGRSTEGMTKFRIGATPCSKFFTNTYSHALFVNRIYDIKLPPTLKLWRDKAKFLTSLRQKPQFPRDEVSFVTQRIIPCLSMLCIVSQNVNWRCSWEKK